MEPGDQSYMNRRNFIAGSLGVLLPPGAHVVELRFWPVGLSAGLWVLVAGAAVLAATTLFQQRKHRHFVSPQ